MIMWFPKERPILEYEREESEGIILRRNTGEKQHLRSNGLTAARLSEQIVIEL